MATIYSVIFRLKWDPVTTLWPCWWKKWRTTDGQDRCESIKEVLSGNWKWVVLQLGVGWGANRHSPYRLNISGDI